jgi:predicted ATPase
LIGVEEPELTVHPGALPTVYDYLAQAAKRSQVLFTTHSPDLLDRVDTADVRVVERKEGATTVAPMLEEQREVVRKRLMSLGELQRTEGIKQLELDLAEDAG